ncbi:hypothetical protein MUK42_24201 [Musa troglodytarum]|uniref:Uncharacterized protein n=1 Tax=Musa troglodytarum TaxID=320322 RepID=A0A9E7EXQ1_9LILI|nr:hypothetical protein MUK42_24201 [Musa troglodytarum]
MKKDRKPMQERLAMEEIERGGGRCAAAFSWLAREWGNVRRECLRRTRVGKSWAGGKGEVERYARLRAVARLRGGAVLADRYDGWGPSQG